MWPKPPINYIHALIDRCVAMKGGGGGGVKSTFHTLFPCVHEIFKSLLQCHIYCA